MEKQLQPRILDGSQSIPRKSPLQLSLAQPVPVIFCDTWKIFDRSSKTEFLTEKELLPFAAADLSSLQLQNLSDPLKP